MSGLIELERQAVEACEFRGHTIGKWVVYHGESKSLANNECLICGAWVQCNTKPAPNDIDIGGPAVALTCTNPVLPKGEGLRFLRDTNGRFTKYKKEESK